MTLAPSAVSRGLCLAPSDPAGPDRGVVADRIVIEVIVNRGSIELFVNNAADQSSGN